MASSSCGPGCALASEAYSKHGVSNSESSPDKRLAEEDSLQASQNHDLSQLARASINHGVAATARCGEQRKGYVPNPKTRAALSVAYTLPIRFLTKKEPMQLSELLSELPLLKSHGCQDQVKNFLLDEHFPWSNLAIVRRHHYHRNIHYGIQSAMEDSDILGVVAVKSCCQLQETQTLKIFYYSWLLSLDPCVIRDIFTHGFVLQVAGPRPLHDKRDVRRNHFTVGGVTDHTQIEAEIKTFIMDDCKKHFKEEDKNLKDVLRRINGVRELVAASSTSNLKLRGRGLDFCRLAKYVTKRFEKRSQRPTLSSLLRPSNTSTGAWNPGNLFKCTFSQADCHLVSPECQELDGCIVVLLPWEDSTGNFQLQKYPKLALVARVDTTYHSICLVPKIALHPCDFLKLPKHLPIPAEVLKHLPHAYDFPKMPGQKKTILSQFKYLNINAQRTVLAQDLKNMYKYKVLIRPPGSKWDEHCHQRLAEEDSLQASQNHDLSQLARASINHGVAATARCGEQRKGYVPNPKTRAALSVAYTLPIRFLTKKEPMQLSELLSELPLLKSHGCQDQVKNFLLDEHFPWSNLAIVRRHHYHRNIHYGIQSAMEDSDILGVVAVKSCCQLQETQTLKIFYYSWLLSLDPCVIRDIFTHGFVLQVAGPRPLHDKRDVRRNHFTVGGVTDHTQIEAEIKTFIMDDCKKHFKEEDKNLKDVLRRINGVRELVAASSTSNLKLRGRGLDFCRLAKYVTKRFEKRSQRPTLSSLLRPSNTSTGAWNPGNLFKCTFSQADCHLVSPECQELDGCIVVLLPWEDSTGNFQLQKYQKLALVARVDTTYHSICLATLPLELDGCIVVLLPWEDSTGNFQLQKYQKLALVARVDTTYHSICLVPKIALHPCDFLKLPKHLPIPAEVLKHLPHAYDFPKMPGQKKTILSQFKYLNINAQRTVLAQDLKNMYKYKVLIRPPGSKWDEHCHQALLCMTLVGWSDRCYVCFEHDIDQHKFQVQADDLRLALPVSEQHLDAAGGITVADSEQVRRGGGPLKHLCDNPKSPCKPLRTKQLPVDWYCGTTSEDGMRLGARDKTIPSAGLKTEAGRAEVKGPTQEEMKS
eukprot:Skav211259  [mRNA]  locus=scaffold3676:171867:175228:+ [translate_table: standard]